MTRPVRIAVQLMPQDVPDYAVIRDALFRAEEAGVDIAFNWDHFFPLFGDPGAAHFECWTMLAAWAEQTSRIQIGALVTCNSYRNPDLLADMARTVDHISGGRLIFGIGSGWFERDYTEYGYEFGTAGKRLDDLALALPRIQDRWRKLVPPPTRQLPVLIGGGGEKKTLKLVAEYADIWHYFVDPESYRHKAAILNQHCANIGRNPAEIEHSAELTVAGRPKNLTEIKKDADALHAEGITLFTLAALGPQYDLTPAKEMCAWRDQLT